MAVEVFEKPEAPGEWAVEALDTDHDGGIDVTIFAGPQAENRAQEYAAWKYSERSVQAA